MICPRCGSFISPGDAYCPECGATFRTAEDECSPTSKPKANRTNEKSKLEELCGDETIREQYIDRYVKHIKDSNIADAYIAVNEYLEMYPADCDFMLKIACKAIVYHDEPMKHEMYYQLDVWESGSPRMEFDYE